MDNAKEEDNGLPFKNPWSLRAETGHKGYLVPNLYSRDGNTKAHGGEDLI